MTRQKHGPKKQKAGTKGQTDTNNRLEGNVQGDRLAVFLRGVGSDRVVHRKSAAERDQRQN